MPLPAQLYRVVRGMLRGREPRSGFGHRSFVGLDWCERKKWTDQQKRATGLESPSGRLGKN